MKKFFNDNKDNLRAALIIFFLSRLLIIGLMYLFNIGALKLQYPQGSYIVNIPLVKHFALYDSYHYVDLAVYGYNSSYPPIPGHQYVKFMEACYFPLYPLSIRLLYHLGIEPNIAGFIISNFCFFAALFFLKKLLLYENINSNIPLCMIAFFPSSMYFSAVYAESMFVLLVVMCFYYARLKKWWIAGIIGFLAALTRNAGLYLSVFLFIEYMIDVNFNIKHIRKDIISIILPILGLLTFMLFEYIKYNDFLAFYHNTFTIAYNRKPISLFNFLTSDLLRGNFLKNPVILFNMLTCYLFLIVLVIMIFDKKVRLSYKIYAIGILYISMSTGYYGDDGIFISLGYIRYVLPCIPIFMYFHKFRNIVNLIIQACFIVMLEYFTFELAFKYFVA